MSKPTKQPSWLAEPEEHDYPAALSYLSLIFDPQLVAMQVAALRKAPMTSLQSEGHLPSFRIAPAGDQQRACRQEPRQDRSRLVAITPVAGQGFRA